MDEVLPSAMVHRYLGEFEVERMFEVGNCGGLREWGATQEIRRLLYGWDNKEIPLSRRNRDAAARANQVRSTQNLPPLWRTK